MGLLSADQTEDRGTAVPMGLAEWRRALSPLAQVESEATGFAAKGNAYKLGDFVVLRGNAGQQTLRRDTGSISRKSHDRMMILYCESGRIEGRITGRTIQVEQGAILLVDLAESFTLLTDGFGVLGLTCPRRRMIMDRASNALHGTVLPATNPLGRLVANHLRELLELAPMTSADVEKAQAVAATRGLLSGLADALALARSDAEDQADPQLIRLLRYIAVNIGERDLGIARLCSEFGVSRATLFRLFNPVGGVASHIRRIRLEGALAELRGPGAERQRLDNIAQRFGFSSEAAFGKAFKAYYGMSPREARRTAEFLTPLSHDRSR